MTKPILFSLELIPYNFLLFGLDKKPLFITVDITQLGHIGHSQCLRFLVYIYTFTVLSLKQSGKA